MFAIKLEEEPLTTGNEVIGDHYEGYEAARRLHKMMEHFDTFKDVKTLVGEDVASEAFKRKPCVRILRYIADEDQEPDGPASEFFVKGKLYRSIDFNGATYSIAGYLDGKRVIGSVYFEWIK